MQELKIPNPTLKYSSPNMDRLIYSKMVVVPSRLWLPLFYPRLSGTELVGEQACHNVFKVHMDLAHACASKAPVSRGWKIGWHRRDGAKTKNEVFCFNLCTPLSCDIRGYAHPSKSPHNSGPIQWARGPPPPRAPHAHECFGMNILSGCTTINF